MKAYVLEAVGKLEYKDVEMPKLQSGWVLLKVKAAGICSSDIPRIFTNGTYHFPTIPGHEFCGEVVKVFDKQDEELIGKRMGVFPLIPCKECEYCKSGHYEMCKNYNYLGSRCDGGFAEYVAVPKWNLIELPDNVSFVQASVLEPLAVGYHAVSAADLTRVKTAAVIGTGAIGLFIAMILQSKGIKVSLLGRNEEKRVLADRCGVDNYINTTQEQSDVQYDLTFEAVGTNASLLQAISKTKSGGQILLVGNPYSDMELKKDVYWQILRRQLTLIGTWNSMYENGAESDWSNVLKLLSTGKVDTAKAITHIFAQDKLFDALDIMRDHNVPYGRIVVKFNE